MIMHSALFQGPANRFSDYIACGARAAAVTRSLFSAISLTLFATVKTEASRLCTRQPKT